MVGITSGWSLFIGFIAGLIGLVMIVAGVKKRAPLPLVFGILISGVPWLLSGVPWLAGLSLVLLVAAYVLIWKKTS